MEQPSACSASLDPDFSVSSETTFASAEKSKEEERSTDQILRQFYDYNFHGDEEFMRGWRKVPNHESPDNYMKAKVFYYSRRHEPVILDMYKKWLADNKLEDKGAPEHAEVESETSNPTDNQGEKSSDSYNLTAEENNVENSCNADSMSIGFGEVIEYIERGLTLPGIKDLNIEPVNTDPKPSEIQRKRKPWEHGD